MEGALQAPKKEEFPRPTIALEDVRTPEEFLQAVDFNVLNDIFDTLIRRVEAEQPASVTGLRVSPERVTFDAKADSHGQEMTAAGRSNVSSGKIALLWGKNDASAHPAYNVLTLLGTLMHEATHVRGGYTARGRERGNEFEVTIRAGLRESRYNRANPHRNKIIALSLNEAITEDISHEVLHEYLIRTGNSAFLNDPRLANELSNSEGYVLDRFVLATVIDALAREVGVPREEVWKGFVQAYMSGNTDVKELFADLERELKSDPNMTELAFSLASGQPLNETGTLTINKVVDRVKNPDHALKVAYRVMNAFNAKQFVHALNLR